MNGTHFIFRGSDIDTYVPMTQSRDS